MDSKYRKRIDIILYDKSPMRKSTVNKIKLEESRSKSNPRDNNLRDSSPSFDKNSSKNHKNQRIIDAKQFLEYKKGSGGIFNQKQIKQTVINSGNSSKTNKSANSYLSHSKTKLNNNFNKSYLTEKSFNLQKLNNSKSREKYADKPLNNKSQEKDRSKEFSTSKSNFTNNSNSKYIQNSSKNNFLTESSNYHNKTKQISITHILPDKTQLIKSNSFYKNEVNEKLRIPSKEKMNAMDYLPKDRYNKEYLETGYSDYYTNFTNKIYNQDNKHTFKPTEDEISYEQNESIFTNYENFRKNKMNENMSRFNLLSNNYIKDKQDLDNHMKNYYLNNSKMDYSRNNCENRINFNETFGRISNKSINNLSEHNRRNKNLDIPLNKPVLSDKIIDNKQLKENIQKYLKQNENNKNYIRNNYSENSFYSNTQNLDYRNSNESRLNTDKSNKNKIGSQNDKEIKVSYDEKMISDYNNYLKQNQETGDSYKFKMTNTHSSGNASNQIDDYKNIKFENVEETHFINVYILQSSKNMLKIQEQVYDEKNLFKTVTQLEEEIDI